MTHIHTNRFNTAALRRACAAIFIAALVLLASWAPVHANSVQEILDDMNLNSEDIPHGVPDFYAWYNHATGRGNTDPKGSAYIRPYFQVYEPASGNPSASARVELGGFQLWVVYGDGVWQKLVDQNEFGGAAYPEDFNLNVRSTLPGDRVGNAVKAGSQANTGTGYNFHGFTDARYNLQNRPIVGVYSTIQARLINDPNGKYLANAGFDYVTETYAAYPDGGEARMKYVTSDWRSFNFTTMSDAALRANPPPPVAGGVDTSATYKVQLKYGGGARFLTQGDNAGGDNTPANVFNDYGVAWQSWRFEAVGDGSYRVRNAYSNKVLTQADNAGADGTAASLFTNYDLDWQRWYLDAQSDGSYRIRNKYSGRILTKGDYNGGDNTPLTLYNDYALDQQRWFLQALAPDPSNLAAQ